MSISHTFENDTNLTIENRRLRATISSLGGELQSIVALCDASQSADASVGECDASVGECAVPAGECAASAGGSAGRGHEKNGVEYLWQGDPAYWGDRAINIFPYIGRLTEGMYRHRGHVYKMDIHGFLKDTHMEVSSKSDDAVTFRTAHNDITKKQYPFSFDLELSYRLDADRLYTMFRVNNTGDEEMYFGLGGHPGFRAPIAEGETFEDYFLAFPDAKNITQILMSDACLTTGETCAFPVGGEGDHVLPLGDEKDRVPPPGGKENFVLPTGGEENLVLPSGGKENLVLPTGGKENPVLPSGGKENFVLPTGGEKNLVLPLRHDLFDRDAIVLEDTGGRVILKSRRSGYGVEVAYPDMKYLALWHTPHTDAPFVCIEPWTSLPSRDGVIEELSVQKDLIELAAGDEYRNSWSIDFFS
jgi:galactose mutarotase-like enzyme